MPKKSSKTISSAPSYPPEYLDLTSTQLRERISSIQSQIAQARKDRVFAQVSRDALARAQTLAESETAAMHAKLLNLESEISNLVKSQSRELAAYKNRIIAIKAEGEAKQKQIAAEEEAKQTAILRASQTAFETDRSMALDITNKTREREVTHTREVLALQETHAQEAVKLKEQYNKQLAELEKSLIAREQTEAEALEVHSKVSIMEIETRKNEHHAELVSQHEEGYAQIKDYYRSVTADNAALIKTLQVECESMRNKSADKLCSELAEENRRMAEPLRDLQCQRDKLVCQLRSHEKNVASLKLLKSQVSVLEAQVASGKKKAQALEDKLKKVQMDRDGIEREYENTVRAEQEKVLNRSRRLVARIEELGFENGGLATQGDKLRLSELELLKAETRREGVRKELIDRLRNMGLDEQAEKFAASVLVETAGKPVASE